MHAASACEGVIDAGVAVDVDQVVTGEGGADLLHRLGRGVLVVAGEMQRQRHLDVAGFAEILVDGDAVVTHGAVDAGAGRGQVGKTATETEAERADLALDLRHRPHGLHRGGDVLHALVGVERLEVFERLGPVGLGVAQLDAGLDAPEKIRGDDGIAFLGVVVGHLADEAVQAEDLLAQDDAGAMAGTRHRDVRLELAAVLGGDLDPASGHDVRPLVALVDMAPR